MGQHQASDNMKITCVVRAVCCSSFFLLGTGQMAKAQDGQSETAAVKATVQQFHAALSAGNAEAAARLLAPDAVVMEGGETETRDAYISHHLPEDIKFAKAVSSKYGRIEVTVAGDVAWSSATSSTQGTYRSKDLNLIGAELMVLTRTPAGWQIRAIHWSSQRGR
jgi:ketosteroid isomerase-like protein